MAHHVQTGRTGVANGDIHPYCAVKIDTSTDNRLIEATAGSQAIGIAGKGTRYPPVLGLDDTLIAKVNENFLFWGEGEENVPAKLGGTVTTERRLKVTTGGQLIPITADGDFYIAIARMAGVSGEIIPVDVKFGQVAA